MQNETVTRLLQELMAELSGDKAEAAVLEGVKQCPKCHRWLPESKEYFHGDASKDDGLMAKCKTCAIVAKKISQRERKLNKIQDELESLTSQEVELMADLDALRVEQDSVRYAKLH